MIAERSDSTSVTMNLTTYFANYAIWQHNQFEATFIDTLRDRQMVGFRPEAIQKRQLKYRRCKVKTVLKINTQPKPLQPQQHT